MTNSVSGPRARVLRAWAIRAGAGVAVCAALAACGGSSGSGSSTSAKATTTTATTSLPTRPTSIPKALTPIDKKIPTGKTIAYIVTGTEDDLILLKQAAKTLDWTLKAYTPNGDSASDYAAAFQEAVASHPDGIIYASLAKALVGRSLLAAKAAGIPVVSISTVEPISSLPAVIATAGGFDYTVKEEGTGAKLMGQLAAPHTGMAFIEITGYTPVGKIEATVKKDATRACPSCTYYLKDINVTQSSEGPSIIASFLRAHPNIKTIFGSYYPSMGVGLEAQLQSLGVTGVKVLMSVLTRQGWQAVKDGSAPMAGGSFYPYGETAYMAMDALVRHFVGENPAVDDTPPTPYWFVTKNAPAEYSLGAVADYRQQFDKLWGK